jgi:hypothetical protein
MVHARYYRSRVSPGGRVPPRLMLKPRPVRHHHGKVGSPERDDTVTGYKMDSLCVSLPENASPLSSCHGFSASKITPTSLTTSEPATWTIHQSMTPMSITRPHRHVARHGPGSCRLRVQSLVPWHANLPVSGSRRMGSNGSNGTSQHAMLILPTCSISSYVP